MKNGNQAESFFFGELDEGQEKEFENQLRKNGAGGKDLLFLSEAQKKLLQSEWGDLEKEGDSRACSSPETLSLLIENRLAEKEREQVVAHLTHCPLCRAEFVELLEIRNLPALSLPAALKEYALSLEAGRREGKDEDRIGEGKPLWKRVAYAKLLPVGIAAALILLLVPAVYKSLTPPVTELLLSEPIDLRSPVPSETWKEGTLSVDLGQKNSRVCEVLTKIRKALGPSPEQEAIRDTLGTKSLLLELLNAFDMKPLLGGREVRGEDLLQKLYVKMKSSPCSIFDFIKEETVTDYEGLLLLLPREGKEGKWEVVLQFTQKN